MTRSTSATNRVRRTTSALLVALAVAGLLAGAGSIPHNHTGVQQGLYNQEHDLTLLATAGSGALLPNSTAAAVLVLIAVPLVPLVAHRPVMPARRHADPRAPPVC